MCEIQSAKRNWFLSRMACYAKGENQNKPYGLVVTFGPNEKKDLWACEYIRPKKRKKEMPCGLGEGSPAQVRKDVGH